MDAPTGRRPLAERPVQMLRSEAADMILRGAFDPYLASIASAIERRQLAIRAQMLKDVQNVFGPEAAIIDEDGNRLR